MFDDKHKERERMVRDENMLVMCTLCVHAVVYGYEVNCLDKRIYPLMIKSESEWQGMD